MANVLINTWISSNRDVIKLSSIVRKNSQIYFQIFAAKLYIVVKTMLILGLNLILQSIVSLIRTVLPFIIYYLIGSTCIHSSEIIKYVQSKVYRN